MPSKIIKRIPWDRVLRDVSYNHKSDSIEFSLKDIDSLLGYIENLQSSLDSKSIANKQLQEENDKLRSQLLMEALKKKPEPIGKFIDMQG